MTEPTIAIESPDQSEVQAMFDEARALYLTMYPGGRSRLPQIVDTLVAFGRAR